MTLCLQKQGLREYIRSLISATARIVPCTGGTECMDLCFAYYSNNIPAKSVESHDWDLSGYDCRHEYILELCTAAVAVLIFMRWIAT